MKYYRLWEQYSYKQSNMIKRHPIDLGALIISTLIVSIFSFATFNIIQPKPKVKDNLILEAEESDRIKQAEIEKKYKEEREKEYQAKKLAYRVEELNEKFVRGDWVIITWWMHPSPSPEAPVGTSRTGQIKKIVGDKVYGTWGDNALTYSEDVWHRCSQQEYLEARKKEQLEKDKKEKKKKKFVSWGLHPSMRK